MSLPSYKMFQTVTNASPGGRYVSDGVAASSTNTYYSSRFSFSVDTDAVGFTLETSGTLTGAFTLWLSDHDHPSEADDTDWDQVAAWSPTDPAGAATKEKYSVTDLRGKWWRVKYVNESGTGTLTGYAVSGVAK